jgi:hypothetical protein
MSATYHYATEDGSGAYLLEDLSGYYLREDNFTLPSVPDPYFTIVMPGRLFAIFDPRIAWGHA